MKVIWKFAVLIAAAFNAIAVAHAWYTGGQPDWFVWFSSIWFSIGMAITCLKDLSETRV